MHALKIILFFLIITFSKVLIAQDFSNSWKGHFSYLDIKDISQGANKVYGAAQNAVFVFDTQTNEIEKISSINGLAGETISNIKYVEENGILLIGYENGLLQVYNESNKEIITVVDIINKPTIPPNNKKINHFMIYNNFAYISTDYGISLYDIENLEFGDTYFIGSGGSQLKVRQTTIFENTIYAATQSSIFRAEVDNPNLIDFQQWTSFANGANWVGIQFINGKGYVARTSGLLYELVSNSISIVENYGLAIQDIRNSEGNLVVTTLNEVHVYDVDTFTEIALAVPTTEFDTQFSSAITIDNEIFIGTKDQVGLGKSGFGILKTTFLTTDIFEEIHPESPLTNKFFKIQSQAGHVWGTHGGQSITFNFNGGVRKTGISHLIQDEWKNISYDSLETTLFRPWYLSFISINPFNSSEAYIGSYYSGLLEVNNETISIYDQSNSTIVPFAGALHLTLASKYDNEGALWVLNGRTNFALNKFLDGNWSSFSLESVISSATSNLGFGAIAFDGSEKIFIGSHNFGIIGFKKNGGNPIIKNIVGEEFSFPSEAVKAIAVDQQNQVWIGTTQGLRVIFNTEEFFEDPNYSPSEIIVLDDGIARELLFQQFITDIKVDGANNKWISTLDTGVYYFSSDGQRTIYHFTKDNSPLPTNDVLSVALDETNGVVYFATDKGLVSFNSETSVPEINLEEAFVFPNPVRPDFNINDKKIKIRGISGNVNIKITDIEGNLVTEAETRTNTKFNGYNLEIDGGTALWNGKNMSGRTVATGVYMVMISDLDSFETKVLKLMVVR